jgi:tetratricopeptide (TPR) repeat protein
MVSPGAVFLSYSSQDAEAARTLCEALRSAGVEVWFDQSALRGGDAWDAKIRRQIRECALFLPIISENAQRRKEGYFRLEWRLAEQRTHLMGRDKAFLVPVCIDDTNDAEADVPEAFMAVQWTRLAGGQPTPAFAQRVRELLAGDPIQGKPAARLPHALPPQPASPQVASRRWLFPAVSLAILAAALGVWRWTRPSMAPSGRALLSSDDAAHQSAAALIARSRALIDNINYARADLGLAEKFMAQATDLAGDSAQAWSLRGYIQALYVLRTWDYSPNRLRDAQTFCNQALALNPNNTEAMYALAVILNFQEAYDQAEALMRKAMLLDPSDPRLPRMLASNVFSSGHWDEALGLFQDNVKRFHEDPLSWYDLGLYNNFAGHADAALDAYRHAVALSPVAGGYIAIADILATKGDLAGAEAAADQIPVENRSDDRAVSLVMWLGILERQPDRVIAAGGRTAADYFNDAQRRGPKAFLTALAYEIAGKPALAAHEWDEAARVLRERLQTEPPGLNRDLDQMYLAIALAWNGQRTEAAEIVANLEPAQREMEHPPLAGPLARYYAACGDAAQAARWLKSVGSLGFKMSTPWWEKVRDAPEFKGLLVPVQGPTKGGS